MNQNYILAPYVKVGYSTKGLEMGFGSIQTTIPDPSLHHAYLAAAVYFLKPHSLEQFRYYLITDLHLSEIIANEVIDLFIKKNLLIEEDVYEKGDRYSRHKLFYNLSGGSPSEVQQGLSKKHVVILGCGGIGNLIGVNLATAGVGELTLIDSDVIEISNLTRQIMFTEDDVGSSKTHTLSREFKKRNSQVTLNILNERIDSKDKFHLIPKCDLVVASGDSIGIMNHLNSICYRTNTPFTNIGYIQDIAVWGPIFIPGITACYECFSKNNIASSLSSDLLNKKLMNEINVTYQAPSIGPVNMLASSLAALDILKYLGNFGKVHSIDSRVGIWTHNLEVQKQPNQRQPSCEICIY